MHCGEWRITVRIYLFNLRLVLFLLNCPWFALLLFNQIKDGNVRDAYQVASWRALLVYGFGLEYLSKIWAFMEMSCFAAARHASLTPICICFALSWIILYYRYNKVLILLFTTLSLLPLLYYYIDAKLFDLSEKKNCCRVSIFSFLYLFGKRDETTIALWWVILMCNKKWSFTIFKWLSCILLKSKSRIEIIPKKHNLNYHINLNIIFNSFLFKWVQNHRPS